MHEVHHNPRIITLTPVENVVRKNHKTDKCKKTSCKKCKSKEHKTMFCTVDPVLDQLCTFCGKSKHTAECCRACKKAEKKARAQESGAARSNASNPLMSATQQTRGPPTSASGTYRIPLSRTTTYSSVCPPPMIGERLQQLASSADGVTSIIPIWRNTTPHIYGRRQNGPWQSLLYSRISPLPFLLLPLVCITNTNGGGTQSTSLNSSLESHMPQLSRTMLQLAQTKQVMANQQCQNHQAMVSVQKQQTEAFKCFSCCNRAKEI